jgi:hypothetical protein
LECAQFLPDRIKGIQKVEKESEKAQNEMVDRRERFMADENDMGQKANTE